MPDDIPGTPDGPTPAREQLPLPRRNRQSHLEPQLRDPGGPGAGTPFTPFAAEAATGEIPVVRPGRGDAPSSTPTNTSGNAPTSAPADRAAAFRAGARRGGSAARPRPRSSGPHRSDR